MVLRVQAPPCEAGVMGFRVRCWADAFNGCWVVVRDDGRVLHASESVRECLKWVKTWGPSIGQERAGIPLEGEVA